MLTREKKRTLWILAVGLTLAVVIESALHVLSWRSSVRLSALVAKCKADPEHDYRVGLDRGKWHVLCTPSELESVQPVEPLKPVAFNGLAKEILDADLDVRSYEAYQWVVSGLLALASVIPLVWYFLLDRVRELSAAVSGRDRQG
jgi:hypothetical protein